MSVGNITRRRVGQWWHVEGVVDGRKVGVRIPADAMETDNQHAVMVEGLERIANWQQEQQ